MSGFPILFGKYKIYAIPFRYIWCTGFADSPPVDYVLLKLSIIMVNCRHRLNFASWLVCPDFCHCTYEFRWTLQYFCILQGQLLFRPLTNRSWYEFEFEFVLWQLLGFSMFHARWDFIELWNDFFITQSQLLPPRREPRFSRMGVMTLNK